ncbi:hypothetical protein [Spartinivicinus poritis]|uniref:Uncharacterized protein n=1 Tax=Spartinivicinus poritis TaxID=2994640 RepID=A0ABT5UFC4_9GAMM|nr:hypothetical protein [Spartinivicinus sp. A2-2]MDE1465086.1 hypothetical protein [Spartinivicinus sp. A2-2]
MISQTITESAGITVLKPIDNNISLTGSSQTIGATVIEASQGPVGRPVTVTADNWQSIFGKPLPMSAGTKAEGLRHLKDALTECAACQVVRVVGTGAQFPSLAFPVKPEAPAAKDYKVTVQSTPIVEDDTTKILLSSSALDFTVSTAEADGWTVDINSQLYNLHHFQHGATPVLWIAKDDSINLEAIASGTKLVIHGKTQQAPPEVLTASHPYGTEMAVAQDYWLVVWPVDGHPSNHRRVEITTLDDVDQRFTLAFYEDHYGQSRLVESYQVGIDTDDIDDQGLSAYAPTVLEERSSRFRCQVAYNSRWADVMPLSGAFTGGSNGESPTTEQWIEAWSRLKSDDISFDLLFAAGQYDTTVLAHAISIAEGRLTQFKLDVPPYLTESAALKWLEDANLVSYQAQAIHYPYKANDEWYGGKSLWGASGALVAAKARCYATPTGHGAVSGAHYTAAGESRGLINRRGIEPLHHMGFVLPDERVEARINPVDKGKFINDCLNLWPKNNYLRFEHVVAVLNAISHEFIQAASVAKFEPDGLTLSLLTTLANDICQRRVDAGAFVNPRNPERDGENPFRIDIKQLEIDLWQVEVSFAPTGVARRIALQPKLMR